MQFEVKLPKLGESILTATVVRWFKKEGDSVRLDEPLLEVTTDKVSSEIPSPVAGFVEKIVVAVNQEVPVGALLAILSSSPVASETKSAPSCEHKGAETGQFLSPAVLALLQQKGIPLQEIDRIPRAQSGGRLTKKDVEEYAAAKTRVPLDSEHLKMSALRKAIAENMVRSFYEAPHASLVAEVDVTSLMKLIQNQKEAFFAQHGVKLTLTSWIARAMARSVQAYPLINASLVDGDTIVMKRFVNLGIAVSVEQGVMVPVIHGCQALSLPEIARRIADVAAKARLNQLTLQDVQDGSITLTNFGMTGVLMGTPIIRYPEVAIVGVGSVIKRVVPLDNDAFGVRSMLMVSLTFDHRVLDGLYGCGFLGEVKRRLESDLE